MLHQKRYIFFCAKKNPKHDLEFDQQNSDGKIGIEYSFGIRSPNTTMDWIQQPGPIPPSWAVGGLESCDLTDCVLGCPVTSCLLAV